MCVCVCSYNVNTARCIVLLYALHCTVYTEQSIYVVYIVNICIYIYMLYIIYYKYGSMIVFADGQYRGVWLI